MEQIYRSVKAFMAVVLAVACGGLALLWPDWRAELRAQSYNSIEVPLDIGPQSCPNRLNLIGLGVVQIAILGTDEVDVSRIDPKSTLLEGVPARRWHLDDVATPFVPFTGKKETTDCTAEGPDGEMDLTLTLDKRETARALEDVENGEGLVLMLTGSLKDEFGGAFIAGEDVVIIEK